MRTTVANYAVRRGPRPTPRRFLKRWTRVEYDRLVEVGVLTEEDRIELVDGEIVTKMPQNPPHANCLRLVSRVLRQLLRDRQDLLVQLPLALGADSEPEPDVAVVDGDPRDDPYSHPTNALLVVEVSNSTLALDRGAKASIYAEAGIPEYWVVNLKSRTLEVRREPKPAEASMRGSYDTLEVLTAGQEVSPAFAPDSSIRIADMLP